MTPEQDNAVRAQGRKCVAEIMQTMKCRPKPQCGDPGFVIAEHTSPGIRMHAGRWLQALTLTSSRSKWAIQTRKWFIVCTDPGWLKTTRTRYSS